MPPLEPKQIQDAFSRGVPGMRFEFGQEWDAFRASIHRTTNYIQRYPDEVLRLTGNEMRRRHKRAAN